MFGAILNLEKMNFKYHQLEEMYGLDPCYNACAQVVIRFGFKSASDAVKQSKAMTTACLEKALFMYVKMQPGTPNYNNICELSDTFSY